MERGKNIIYYCEFDAQGKSYDELSDISEKAFESLKYAVEKPSAFSKKQGKAETLKLMRACIGIAALESSELSVSPDLSIDLISDEFKFSELFTLLFANMCSLAKSVKIKAESQKCVVSIE